MIRLTIKRRTLKARSSNNSSRRRKKKNSQTKSRKSKSCLRVRNIEWKRLYSL